MTIDGSGAGRKPGGQRRSVTRVRSGRRRGGGRRAHLDEVLDLRDAAKAHELLEGGHTRGKMVLRVAH